jgi:MarR family transcriptional regulator, organic hydroperoxide resistance regulator
MLLMSKAMRASRSERDELLRDAQTVAGQIRAIDRAVNREVHRDVARSGLTAPQVRALEVLFDSGPLSVKDLSARLRLSHSTVSGIVDRLARRQFVRREAHPDDRRVSRVAVTEEVMRYGRAAPVRLMTPLAETLRTVRRTERKQIIETLQRLVELVDTT